MYKKYKIALALGVVIFSALAFESYKLKKELEQITDSRTLLKKAEENRPVIFNEYGYTSIVEILNNKDNMKIRKINRENDMVSVNIELLGDIYNVEKELKHIKDKEKFIKINNLIMEKNDGILTSRINMSFINNK